MTTNGTRFCRLRRFLSVAGAVLGIGSASAVGSPGKLAAQAADLSLLTRFEQMVDEGQTAGLKRAVESWLEEIELEGAGAIGGREMARVRLLQARLASDMDSARMQLLGAAVEGGSVYSARAWLRMAQLDLAVNEPVRARENLERLRSDHPGTAEAAESWYWTGRALESQGRLDEACAVWVRISGAGSDGVSLARRQFTRDTCGQSPQFAVQVGAFGAFESARSVQGRLRAASYSAWVLDEGDLYRVRVGRFVRRAQAEELAQRLRADGHETMIVEVTP